MQIWVIVLDVPDMFMVTSL